jgi:transcriptional regulator with XRE-family HTH domain
MKDNYAGLIIKRRRKTLGIDQRELARIAGVSVHALSNIESGIGNPTWATLVKVLDALGLELCVQPREATSASRAARGEG